MGLERDWGWGLCGETGGVWMGLVRGGGGKGREGEKGWDAR